MSAGERAPLPTGGNNSLLCGSRTRSYGSLFQSSLSPARQRRIEHKVQPGETLQGLSLKYGVSMEQIKRANRLYTNDSIFLKKSLSIPVLSDSDAYSEGVAFDEDDSGDSIEKEGASELSPMDFLRRMDGSISQSKQAAVKGCQESEQRFAALEAACNIRTSDRFRITRSQSAMSSTLGAVPLMITKRTKELREREDEIFEL